MLPLAVLLTCGFVLPAFAQQEASSATASVLETRPLNDGVSLSRARELRSQGALFVTESLLLSMQPSPDDPDWYAWERELWELYLQQQRWDTLIARLEHTLPRLSAVQARNAQLLLGHALAAAGKPAAARQVLRKVLIDAAGDPLHSIRARRLLIENYLNDNRIEDAYVASIRFQFEYYPDDSRWKLLRARILLLHNEPGHAVMELSDLQGPQVELLMALARLREGEVSPAATMEQMASFASKTREQRTLERLRLGILAESARLAGDLEIRVGALESLVADGEGTLGLLDPVSLDVLLAAYRDLARDLGNREHLLLGDSRSWLQLARRLSAERGPATRALYALILTTDRDSPVAGEALVRLIRSLATNDREPIVMMLYERDMLGTFDTVLTDDIALRMAAYALRQNRFSLASRFNTYIRSPPGGMSDLEWLLRRVRTDVFAGHAERGTNALLDYLNSDIAIDAPELDRVLQIAFDLQIIEGHDLALRLFEAVGERNLSGRQRRELLFWMAQSHAAENRSARAAELYLRSADYKDEGRDSWGMSARFQAAKAMTAGGLYDDARITYLVLLKATANEKRQLQIRQRLQELKLLAAVRERE
ncbi:MAG: hypothetical protein VYB37_07740 [Pseudomonadota bacterium]|nr:hypothetical protein [Pseudomonadota bacterium]